MKFSLRGKILGSFALVVLLALSTAVGTGNRLTRSRYYNFAFERDFARAKWLSKELGEWNSAAGGAAELGMRHSMPPHIGGGMRMMGRGPHMMGDSADSHIVITDLSGKVLYDGAGYDRERLSPDTPRRVPVYDEDNAKVGYLYMGQMIPGAQLSAELLEIRRAGVISWLVTLLIFVFAMILGLVITENIIRPIRVLNQAAREVEGGNLSARVPGGRKDELGDLSRGFNSMTASLEHAAAQRRRLIADSAHELRTPISLIQARVEMMEEGVYPLDADALTALSAEAKRLAALVDELRILSDLESPDSVLEREEFSLETLIREVIKAAEPRVRQLDVAIESNFLGDQSVISADRGKIRRLLVNLLSNALRHAESRVFFSLQGAENSLELHVEDDGPGIAMENLERVFERYFRADRSRSRNSGGAGLGLSICREVARAHGGSIEAGNSETLGGARISLRLPRRGESSELGMKRRFRS